MPTSIPAVANLDSPVGLIERERRYAAPKAFQRPETLGGLIHTQTIAGEHVDQYMDAVGADGTELLRAARCNFRLRELADGTLIACFKRKPVNDRQGAEVSRFEVETVLAPGDQPGPQHHPPAAP
jgi:hypothetical protein